MNRMMKDAGTRETGPWDRRYGELGVAVLIDSIHINANVNTKKQVKTAILAESKHQAQELMEEGNVKIWERNRGDSHGCIGA